MAVWMPKERFSCIFVYVICHRITGMIRKGPCYLFHKVMLKALGFGLRDVDVGVKKVLGTE